MKLRKCIAVILFLTLIISNPASVHAVDVIGEMTTDTSGLNQLTVTATLNAYFNSREAFLLNQVNTIDGLLAGVDDEAAHREKYALKGVGFVGSAISIGNIIAGDIYADADVTETVTYVKDGVTNTATITHKLLLGLTADNLCAVVYDAYYEAFTDFRSCSYVDEANTASINTVTGASSYIVQIAEGEVDYTEGTNGYTKYGEWFTSLYGDLYNYDYTNAAWCVMFVSWCAAQAQIPKSTIAHEANQTVMLNFFNGLGRYHSRTTAVNNWAPATGDLIFFADDRVNASHIGIVRYVDANYIYVVHGNNSQGKVAFMTVSRTNDWVLGYAKPAYCTEHIASKLYSKDSTFHWKDCRICGYDMMKEAHTFVPGGMGEPHACSTCGYTTYSPILGLPTTPGLLCSLIKY